MNKIGVQDVKFTKIINKNFKKKKKEIGTGSGGSRWPQAGNDADALWYFSQTPHRVERNLNSQLHVFLAEIQQGDDRLSLLICVFIILR